MGLGRGVRRRESPLLRPLPRAECAPLKREEEAAEAGEEGTEAAEEVEKKGGTRLDIILLERGGRSRGAQRGGADVQRRKWSNTTPTAQCVN